MNGKETQLQKYLKSNNTLNDRLIIDLVNQAEYLKSEYSQVFESNTDALRYLLKGYDIYVSDIIELADAIYSFIQKQPELYIKNYIDSLCDLKEEIIYKNIYNFIAGSLLKQNNILEIFEYKGTHDSTDNIDITIMDCIIAEKALELKRNDIGKESTVYDCCDNPAFDSTLKAERKAPNSRNH